MIHQYKLRGCNVVLDVFSGSVHVVDDLAYDIIARYESADRETIIREMLSKYASCPEVKRSEIESVFDDLEELREKRKLFVPDVYEGNAFDLKARHTDIKALCLHVAHTCNLNCSYCFAAQGNYHGERELMSFEVGKRALDFLMDHSGSRRNLEVDFFGGEPLMNWEVCKQLVRYARSVEQEKGKCFRFTLTTNGMLLDDEVTTFCNAEMNNVVLSLDGRKEIHDYWRKTPSGKGSYDVIVPKFQSFVREREKAGKSYYIRGTYTARNTDFLNDILHMAGLGFNELSMEPVVCDPSEPYALKEEDLPVLKEQYEELAVEMIRRKRAGKGFTFYHYMIDLTGGPCIYKRISGCGSGTEYLAVTPAGDLYPCHQFVGDERFRMGDIWNGVTNTDLRDSFKLCNAYAREECRDCWAKLYCSGGCAANAYHATGDIRGVYAYGCELFRKRMECAILVKLAEQGFVPQEKENGRMKAIVFDMDGVLFDTEQVYFRAWDIEGKTFGMTPDEVREIRLRCAGHNPADTRVLFNDYFKGRVDFDAFWQKKTERTRQLLREEKIRVKPGLYELLDYLGKNGWAVALATSTNREGTLFNLDQTGITDAFQVLVTGDLFEHGKPDPEIYLRACELLGSRPEETFAVEDSYAGLESARRAGMRVVMIPDLFPPTEETARNADYTLDSLADLQRLLQEEEYR